MANAIHWALAMSDRMRDGSAVSLFSGRFSWRLHDLHDLYSHEISQSGDLELTENHDRPFILGTILHGNKVLINDSYNPQWNNLEYSQDLGLSVYPPYPEASGYAMSS